MPSRNLSMIRRDINRLKDTIERRQDEHKALAAISAMVFSVAEAVNRTWQTFQAATVAGDKEREERDQAIQALIQWTQGWRPVILMLVPGADANIRQLPASGATPDDVIRTAEDMAEFIKGNSGAESFRSEATAALGEMITAAKKETAEASAALPAEAAARQAYSDACLAANDILTRGTEVIRALFGRTSPEYKQFIARITSKEDAEIEEESLVGEQ